MIIDDRTFIVNPAVEGNEPWAYLTLSLGFFIV